MMDGGDNLIEGDIARLIANGDGTGSVRFLCDFKNHNGAQPKSSNINNIRVVNKPNEPISHNTVMPTGSTLVVQSAMHILRV